MTSGTFDFRALKKYLTPQAADDFNMFLEKIPEHAGRNVLIAAGIAWGMAAAFGLVTMMEAKQLTEVRASLQSSSALQPIVPVVKMTPVSQDEMKQLVDTFKGVYPTMTVNASAGKMVLQSKDTASFSEFREALGHVINGGRDWHVGLDALCVGRECQQNALDATLKVEKMSIEKPALQADSATSSSKQPEQSGETK